MRIGAICFSLLLPALALAGEPVSTRSSGGDAFLLDQAMRAKRTPFLANTFLTPLGIGSALPAGKTELACAVYTGRLGRPVRGIRVNLGAFALDQAGGQQRVILASGKTNRAGGVFFIQPMPEGFPATQVKWGADFRGKPIDHAHGDCHLRRAGPCTPTATTACLLDRFLVSIKLDQGDGSGSVEGQVLTNRSGDAEFGFPTGTVSVTVDDRCSGSSITHWDTSATPNLLLNPELDDSFVGFLGIDTTAVDSALLDWEDPEAGFGFDFGDCP